MPEATLIIGPSWVGDMVMAEPLTRLLKDNGADFLTMLAPPASAPVAQRMAAVDEVLSFPLAHGELGLRKRWRIARQLKNRFRQAVVLPNSWKSAWLPCFAGIPRRRGWLGEQRFGVLNEHQRLDTQRLPFMVDRYRALASPTFTLADSKPLTENRSAWPQLSSEESLVKSTDKTVALCPGAEFGPSKRWPAEHFAKLAGKLIDAGVTVQLLGSPGDRAVAEQISADCGNLQNLCGETTLSEAMDQIALADALVCNDSGLMHIAAALDVPVVALFGSTSAAHTPPLSASARVLSLSMDCGPCFERICPLGTGACLRDISPDVVFDAVAQVLA